MTPDGMVFDEGEYFRAVTRAAMDLAVAQRSPQWREAVVFLRANIASDALEMIRARTMPYWPYGYHHGWGTVIRNLLRNHHYGEAAFGVQNLDNIYAELCEEAARGEPNG